MGIVLLILLALALLIFGIIGTIKIAAWLLLFIILGVVLLAIVGMVQPTKQDLAPERPAGGRAVNRRRAAPGSPARGCPTRAAR